MNHAYTTRALEMQQHYGFELKHVPAGTRVLIFGVAHSSNNLVHVSNAEVCDSVPLEFLTLDPEEVFIGE